MSAFFIDIFMNIWQKYADKGLIMLSKTNNEASD